VRVRVRVRQAETMTVARRLGLADVELLLELTLDVLAPQVEGE